MSLFVLALGLGAVVLVYHYALHPLFFSPLAKIPAAHPTAALSSLWIRYQRRHSREIGCVYAAHSKHGPIVRLSPSEVSVASLDGLRNVYVGGFEKHDWYVNEFQNFATPNLVSMLEHRPHSVQKRMVSHVYSKSFLFNCEPLADACKFIVNECFLPKLRSVAASKTPVDVLSFNNGAGADFMSSYLFGVQNMTNFIRDEPARANYLDQHLRKMRGLPGQAAGIKFIEDDCMSRCDAALADLNGSTPTDPSKIATEPVVYKRLHAHLSKSGMSPSQLRLQCASEMLDHLMAGHETSAITLTYLMWELSRNPSLQSRLRTELRSLSCNDGDVPSAQALDALPFLNAVLYETLRLYSAAPAPQPRIVPSQGATIDGFGPIPGGTRISTAAYVMHRNADVWPEPLSWRPERWLQTEKSDGVSAEEMRKWFWAFGSGGRMCLGSNFAILALKLVAASVYANFTTSIVDDEGIEQRDSYISGPKANQLILRFEELST